MEVLWLASDKEPDGAYHAVVFAETGFSALTGYAERFGLARSTAVAFEEAVNRRDEVGTLLPAAPVSAIPRRAIRDCEDPALVKRFVLEFFDGAKANGVALETVFIDFCTPHLAAHARDGIRLALKDLTARPDPWPIRIIVADH